MSISIDLWPYSILMDILKTHNTQFMYVWMSLHYISIIFPHELKLTGNDNAQFFIHKYKFSTLEYTLSNLNVKCTETYIIELVFLYFKKRDFYIYIDTYFTFIYRILVQVYTYTLWKVQNLYTNHYIWIFRTSSSYAFHKRQQWFLCGIAFYKWSQK